VAEAIFEPVGGGRFRIRGEMTFGTVTALLAASRPLFEGPEAALEVDLAGVERADSAGLALVIEWLRGARTAGKAIRFLNTSPQLRAIAQVSDLEGLLPL
jgi:phospholipid transport system transporter-binding protein